MAKVYKLKGDILVVTEIIEHIKRYSKEELKDKKAMLIDTKDARLADIDEVNEMLAEFGV